MESQVEKLRPQYIDESGAGLEAVGPMQGTHHTLTTPSSLHLTRGSVPGSCCLTSTDSRPQSKHLEVLYFRGRKGHDVLRRQSWIQKSSFAHNCTNSPRVPTLVLLVGHSPPTQWVLEAVGRENCLPPSLFPRWQGAVRPSGAEV